MKLRVDDGFATALEHARADRQVQMILGSYRGELTSVDVHRGTDTCTVRVRLRTGGESRVQVCDDSPDTALRQALARAARDVRRRLQLRPRLAHEEPDRVRGAAAVP